MATLIGKTFYFLVGAGMIWAGISGFRRRRKSLKNGDNDPYNAMERFLLTLGSFLPGGSVHESSFFAPVVDLMVLIFGFGCVIGAFLSRN